MTTPNFTRLLLIAYQEYSEIIWATSFMMLDESGQRMDEFVDWLQRELARPLESYEQEFLYQVEKRDIWRPHEDVS
mgnify:CR=1 FL=1